MRFVVGIKKIKFDNSCDKFCFMKCDRVGKCQAKQR